MRRLSRWLTLSTLGLLVACGDGGDPSDPEDVRPDRDGGGIDPIDVGDSGLPDLGSDSSLPDIASDADDAGDGAAADIADGSGDAADAGESATAFIDSLGGQLVFDRVTLNVPRNALSEETALTVGFGDLEAPDGVEPLTPIYFFTPEGQRFSSAVGITVRLDARTDDARIFWTAADTTTFEPLRTNVLDERVTGIITHFSYGFVGRYSDDLCDGEPVNACGGCDVLSGELGDPCGNGGTLACAEGNEALECQGEAVCGDGIVGGEEECDGDSLGGLQCTDFAAFEGGTLGCTDGCAFDFSACDGPDPCEGVSCDEAPTGRCDGSTAISYTAPGICVLGVCRFDEVAEDCGDLVCSAGRCVNAPRTGDLVITEFLADAEGADDGFEWFEVYNTTDRAIDLTGVVVRDNGTDSFTIDTPTSIEGGSYFVFAEVDTAAPGLVDFAWDTASPTFTLANTEDEIILEFDGNIIDRVLYTSAFPTTRARSTTLDDEFLTAAGNETASAWCEGVGAYGADPNQGTPGAVNNDCNPPDPCEDVVCDDPPADTCRGDVAVQYESAGTCSSGECAYAEQTLDCSLLGGCVDGACVVTPALPVPGDLVITEFIADPASTDTDQEWFEIWNALDEPVELGGLVVRDDADDAFTIPVGTIIGPNSFGVVAEAEAAVPGEVVLAWNDLEGRFTLGNSGLDAIVLELDGREIDRVSITLDWVRDAGAATQLDRFGLGSDNDDPLLWCAAVASYDGTNRGTPGAENGFCTDPCAEVVCDTPPPATCDGASALRYDDEGTCFEGLCLYDAAPFDCTDFGGCIDGACAVDPCDGVSCDTPPTNTCEGDVAVVWSSTGVCELGTCSYVETRTDCAAFGGCVEAACVIEASAPGAGDLVITEFLADPAGTDSGLEWFELRNLSGGYLNLDGVTISDEGDDLLTVSGPLVVEDGEHVVFAELETSAPGVVDVAWEAEGRFGLTNSGDAIVVALGDTIIDRVDYATVADWPVVAGASTALDAAALTDDNNVAGAWCEGVGAYGAGDNQGTPGLANPPCPIDLCEGVVCGTVPAPSCDGDFAVVFAEPGVCVDGLCEWATNRTDCAPFGGCVDGACVSPPRTAAAGDLVITEFLANPDGADTGLEWFEVLILSDEPIDLGGIVLTDGAADRITLPASYYVFPADRLVFGASADAVPDGVDLDWSELGGFTLGNTTDTIAFVDALDADIERITWAPAWPLLSGYATALDVGAETADRNDPTFWCPSRGAYGVPPNQGTPGVTNIECDAVICGDGLTQGDEECDDGNLETGDGCDDLCVVEPDPCADVVCDAPPMGMCDGTVAVTYASTGTCALGSCTYEETRTECAPDGACVDAACVSVGARPVAAGDLVITEFLADSGGAEPETEWFEITNVSGARLELQGMVIDDDGSDNETVSGSLEMPPGAVFVLAATTGAVPGNVDYAYGIDYALANSGDEIILRTAAGAVIDRVDYTGSWTTDSVSISLSGSALDSDNNELSNWCDGAGEYGVGDNEGTPGEANPDC